MKRDKERNTLCRNDVDVVIRVSLVFLCEILSLADITKMKFIVPILFETAVLINFLKWIFFSHFPNKINIIF